MSQTTDTLFPCGNCNPLSLMTTKVCNVKPVICGIMHPVRESVIFSMNTCLTQAAHDTVQNVTVQITLIALLRI